MNTQRARIASPGASQLFLTLGLVLLWCLLWGDFSVLTLLTGLVLGVLVSVLFYLPSVELSGRVNPVRMLWFFLVLLWDIMRGSAIVAWLAVAPGYKPSNAIVGVQLHTRSDLIMSFTSTAISIVPGSIVVDLDRNASILYVHVIDVENDEQIDHFVSEVIRTERRIILAIGSGEEAASVRHLDKMASVSSAATTEGTTT